MRIGVLGCAGYLGSVLCNRLLETTDYEIVGLSRCYSAPCETVFNLIPNPRFKFIGADALVDKKVVETLIKSVDIAVNLMGLVGEPICKKYPMACYEINEYLAAWVASFGTNLIFASTGSVYGGVADVCTENSPTNPVSDYAVAKLHAEQKIQESPSNHIIYRFGTAFGLSPKLRLDLLVNDLTYRAVKEKSITLYQPHFKRSFVHVADITDAIIHGIRNFNVIKNNIYNVSNENGNWSKGQLAEYLKTKTGCDVFYGGENGYKDSDVRNYEFSTKRINSTGWKAKVSVEQGIDELIQAIPAMRHHGPFHKA